MFLRDRLWTHCGIHPRNMLAGAGLGHSSPATRRIWKLPKPIWWDALSTGGGPQLHRWRSDRRSFAGPKGCCALASTRDPLFLAALAGLLIPVTAEANVGDPQVRIDHPW